MGRKSRMKKAEAAETAAGSSGQSSARSEAERIGQLSLGGNQSGAESQPSTSGQAQQKKTAGQPGAPKQQQQQPEPPKQQQQQQQGPPKQQQQQPGPQKQQPQPGQQKQQQQQQGPPKQQQQQPGPQKQQRQQQGLPKQQQQQPGPQKQQPQPGQQKQQQQQQRGPQQPASARGPGQQQSPWHGQGQGAASDHGSGQQPQTTPWTQKTPSQAAGNQGQQAQRSQGGGGGGQRPAQSQRPAQKPAHGKGDQVSKPVIIPYDYRICPYKGPGTKGKKHFIETNYLKLDVSKLAASAYHYDVSIDFEPSIALKAPSKKFMHPVFAAFVKKNFPNASLAYDGQKNAYAPRQLDLSKPYENVINVTDDETGQTRSFRVEIKEVKGSFIDLSILKDYSRAASIDIPMRAIQCLDIVLKSAFQNRSFSGKLVGRSFYMRPDRPVDLGDCYELWIGMFQSTILGKIPYVNVDIAHKAFPKRTDILDLIPQLAFRGNVDLRRPLDYQILTNLTNHLRGLDIGYDWPLGGKPVRAYKFVRLTEAASNVKFSFENREITVQRYFADRGYQLRYPHLPCIATQSKSYLPIECCFVIGGQAVNKKTTENQTRAMIKEAATSTDVRKQKIERILNQIRYNEAPSVQGFGLKVSDKFEEIPARVLDPPSLEYAQKRTAKVFRGEWRPDNLKFIAAEQAMNWGAVILDGRVRRSDVEQVCNMILRVSQGNGMMFNPKYFVETFDSRGSDRDLDGLLHQIKKENCRVLFCIIPDRGEWYARVKQAAELRCGVLTQCIKGFTVQRKGQDQSTISNILLKVNAKLNGFNHKLQNSVILKRSKCMVIGADVTHPSPDQSRIPSVVGVAASHDTDAFQYNICWRLQDPRQEMIQDFKAIILEQLDFYKKKNGVFPESILYFRDGVSEGQFTEIQNVELKALQEACKMKYGPEYTKKVKITMVVVQKRHHTRFFPGRSGIGSNDRKNNNVPPGTIVDQQITPPNENHFYLVSHQSIQGVAKPTKYCILHDDANLNIDDLQALTYELCHMFTRCNRSVSYPAPTYYAHLAAYRGRVYIEGKNELNMNNLQNEWNTRQIREDIIKGHPMYFV